MKEKMNQAIFRAKLISLFLCFLVRVTALLYKYHPQKVGELIDMINSMSKKFEEPLSEEEEKGA